MSRSGYPTLRYRKTMEFLKRHIPPGVRVLDMGTRNPFSELMEREGYLVTNTGGEDLDNDFTAVDNFGGDCYSSFELFEHLLAPYNILKHIEKGRLVASVPLKVWFSPAFWNRNNEWDRHYHEFEPRQFDWLLEKSGWRIIASETWTSPDRFRPGIRPLLRYIWPSYYFVYAEKG